MKKIYKSYIVVTAFLFVAPNILVAEESSFEKKLLNGFSDLKKNLLNAISTVNSETENTRAAHETDAMVLGTEFGKDEKQLPYKLSGMNVNADTNQTNSKIEIEPSVEKERQTNLNVKINGRVGDDSHEPSGTRPELELKSHVLETVAGDNIKNTDSLRCVSSTTKKSFSTLKKFKIWINLKNKIEKRQDFEKELAKFKYTFYSDPYLIKKVDEMLLKAPSSYKRVTGIRKLLVSFFKRLVYIRPNNEKLEEVSNYILSSNNSG